MNTDWDDLIQKHVSGIASDEETQQLFAALKVDDAVADLYLRHVGLGLALEAKAASLEATCSRPLVRRGRASNPSVWRVRPAHPNPRQNLHGK
jgi:hypothetical protein